MEDLMNQAETREQGRAAETDKGIGASTGMGAAPSVGDAAAESLKSEFAGQIPEAAIPVYLEYAKAVAIHLGDKLHEPVTLKSLIDAKLSALEFCISDGWAPRLTKAVLEASGVEKGIFTEMMDAALEMMPALVEQMKDFVKDIPAVLAELGITEQLMMKSEKVGLNKANLKKYADGTLTLGELYMTQPSVIIKNTD
jgi:hypothetical protein